MQEALYKRGLELGQSSLSKESDRLIFIASAVDQLGNKEGESSVWSLKRLRQGIKNFYKELNTYLTGLLMVSQTGWRNIQCIFLLYIMLEDIN